jgi:hypothetical protein
LGVILVSLGIAKIDEETIPKQLSDMPIVALDDFRTSSLIGTDDFPAKLAIITVPSVRK